MHSVTERGVDFVQSHDPTRPMRVSKLEPQASTIHHRLSIVRTKLVLDEASQSLGLLPPESLLDGSKTAIHSRVMTCRRINVATCITCSESLCVALANWTPRFERRSRKIQHNLDATSLSYTSRAGCT